MNLVIGSCQNYEDTRILIRIICIKAYRLFGLHEAHSRTIYATATLGMRDADIRRDDNIGPELLDFFDDDFRIFFLDGPISQQWCTGCPNSLPPIRKTFMERIMI